MSVLYSHIYATEMAISPSASTTSTSTALSLGAGNTAGPVGVWNGTGVKLFAVQEGVKVGPSLAQPRGAVDAVGTRLVQGVAGLGIGGWMRGVGGAGNGGRADTTAGSAGRGVREV
jgi:hypothetical protein